MRRARNSDEFDFIVSPPVTATSSRQSLRHMLAQQQRDLQDQSLLPSPPLPIRRREPSGGREGGVEATSPNYKRKGPQRPAMAGGVLFPTSAEKNNIGNKTVTPPQDTVLTVEEKQPQEQMEIVVEQDGSPSKLPKLAVTDCGSVSCRSFSDTIISIPHDAPDREAPYRSSPGQQHITEATTAANDPDLESRSPQARSAPAPSQPLAVKRPAPPSSASPRANPQRDSATSHSQGRPTRRAKSASRYSLDNPSVQMQEASALTDVLQHAADILSSYRHLRVGLTDDEREALVAITKLINVEGVKAIRNHDDESRGSVEEGPQQQAKDPLDVSSGEQSLREQSNYTQLLKGEVEGIYTAPNEDAVGRAATPPLQQQQQQQQLIPLQLCKMLHSINDLKVKSSAKALSQVAVQFIPQLKGVYIWSRMGDFLVRADKQITVPSPPGATANALQWVLQRNSVLCKRSALFLPLVSTELTALAAEETSFVAEPAHLKSLTKLRHILHSSSEDVMSTTGSSVGVMEFVFHESANLLESGEESSFSIPRSIKSVVEYISSFSSRMVDRWKIAAAYKRNNQLAEELLNLSDRVAVDLLSEEKFSRAVVDTVRVLCNAERCALFVEHGDYCIGYPGESSGPQRIVMPKHVGIVGRCFATKKTLNIPDAYASEFFYQDVDNETGYLTKSLLCVPIFHDGVVVAVAQLLNKVPAKVGNIFVQQPFSADDEALLESFSPFIVYHLWACRSNSELHAEKIKEDRLFNAIEMVAKVDILDQNELLHSIEHAGKNLLSDGVDSVVFLKVEKERSRLVNESRNVRVEFAGILGEVATTGHEVVTEHPLEDKRFDSGVDCHPLLVDTKNPVCNIACFPVTFSKDILGVLKLMNRRDARGNRAVFSQADVELLRAFTMFLGVLVRNSTLLDFAVKAGRAATRLTEGFRQRRGSYTPSNRETSARAHVLEISLPQWILDTMTLHTFDIWALRREPAADVYATRLALELILSTGLPEKFGCSQTTLTSYIIACREKYRKVPYHNFYHAVDVLQTIIVFLYRGRVVELLKPFEVFVLLITVLGHDIDHMGLNNSFHLKADSALGILSSASGNQSVLEVHHCNLTIDILLSETTGVFAKLTQQDQTQAFRQLVDVILATDMAKHNEYVQQLKAAIAEPSSEQDSQEFRKLILILLMKAADISNVTKPFDVSKKWAEAVTEEFYCQGDAEKQSGLDVNPLFDREKAATLAKSQLGFIKFVAGPYFSALVQLLPGMQFTVEQMDQNKAQWMLAEEEQQ